jgi:hypothetical protein
MKMKDKKHIKTFEKHQENLNVSDVSDSNSNNLEIIENKIVELLNEADNKLDSEDFHRLSESIIDYIDEIGRSKR